MSNVWLTSDSHFNHRAMAPGGGQRGWRPFENIREHDEYLLERWNEKVRPGDKAIHVGDVGIGHDSNIFAIVDRLHGEKHLIAGNHDGCWPGHRNAHRQQRPWLEHFESVQAYARRRVGNGRNFLLYHLPYEGDHTEGERYTEFRLRDEGLPLVHGHVHDLWKVNHTSKGTPMINVGVDVWDWTPVHVDEVVSLF